MLRRHGPDARGFSLIELMIAMAILAFGLLAMWRLHVFGITSTAAGRRHTAAMAFARELAAGLERLPYNDAQLTENFSGTTVPAGNAFGYLTNPGATVSVVAHDWNDGTPVPGVRLSAELDQAEGTAFQRRWVVWGMLSPRAPGGPSRTKLIGVSVAWTDPGLQIRREVILYTQLQDPAALAAALGAATP